MAENKVFGKRKYLLLALVITLAVLGVLGYLYYSQPTTKSQKPVTRSSTATPKVQKRDIKNELNETIKANFGGTRYFKDIDAFIRLAEKSKTADEAYQNYLRAFKKINEAYKETKNPNYRSVLVQMKDFLKVFPSFKESDVVIPK